ncbi:MAG TPA: DUF92 domain-containing protein, partial [Ignavibacteriaceae bacterium]|nr:DUF92 domain-containing protein [Ignavibacteriaceae bacterium]
RLKLLTISGSVSTFLLALVVYTLGNLKWTLPIVTFFVLSSLLSKIRKNKNEEVEKYFEKSDQRDFFQVLANGGLGGILVSLNYFYPSKIFYLIYLSLLAAVCADTWSTEIGTLFKTKTIDILSFKEITQGMSGGISFPGILAAIAGAFVIAATSLPWLESNYKINIIIITLAGFIGSLVDSVLGSSLQAQFKCNVCNTITERKFHCDKETDLVKGKTWINNDVVNFGTGISGGIFSIILYDVFKS